MTDNKAKFRNSSSRQAKLLVDSIVNASDKTRKRRRNSRRGIILRRRFLMTIFVLMVMIAAISILHEFVPEFIMSPSAMP